MQEAYHPPCSHRNFLLLLGGVLYKKLFSQSEHVSSQIWCQKFFPLLGVGSLDKNFFPVWTCIKPNLVSKNFPFTVTGYPPKKIWDWVPPKKIWDLGTPPKIWDLGPPPQKSETWDPPKNLRPGPPENLRPGTPPENLRPGTPPTLTWTWVPPPESVDRHTDWCQNITFPRTTYAGGKKKVRA